MPTAALGGRAEVMDYLAPLGPVYQAGTLSGNPVAMAAGVATLTHATPEVYSFVDARSLELSAALSSALDAAGVDHSIQRAGNLFSVAFGTAARGVHNYDDAQGQEVFRYAPFFHSMLDSGRLPAAVGLRSLVPLRRARRRRDEPDLRRPAGRGEGGGRREAVASGPLRRI